MPDPTDLTLLLVRHGRTRYNDERRLQGWCDSELTAAGLAGVQATAELLRPAPISAAYVSPAGRTRTTARTILRHHPGIREVVLDGLREFGFGRLEAMPEAELYGTTDPLTLFGQVFDGTHPGLPGGESAATFLARVRAAFRQIETAHRPGGTVLVVSHGVTLATYLALVGHLPDEPLPNGSVTTVTVSPDGERVVRSVGVDPMCSATGAGSPGSAEPSPLSPAVGGR